MYAAHFAAALAIKSRVPKAPVVALLLGAFVPDFFWIAFGLAGIEPSQGPAFSMIGRTPWPWWCSGPHFSR